MLVVTGYFDNSGSPALKLKIAAPNHQGGQQLTAILDTGFTGFLSVPSKLAAQLGLKPGQVTTDVELADGTIGPRPLAEGAVILEDRRISGPIILEEDSNDVLAGMDFLRTFNLLLLVGSDAVMLIHETELATAIKGAITRARSTGVLPPPANQIIQIRPKSEEPK